MRSCTVALTQYCSPLDEFIDEHIKLTILHKKASFVPSESVLYNRTIDDDHFSPAGAALWAEIVGRRLLRVLR